MNVRSIWSFMLKAYFIFGFIHRHAERHSQAIWNGEMFIVAKMHINVSFLELRSISARISKTRLNESNFNLEKKRTETTSMEIHMHSLVIECFSLLCRIRKLAHKCILPFLYYSLEGKKIAHNFTINIELRVFFPCLPLMKSTNQVSFARIYVQQSSAKRLEVTQCNNTMKLHNFLLTNNSIYSNQHCRYFNDRYRCSLLLFKWSANYFWLAIYCC